MIEVVTGRPIAEVIREKLLSPLGMNETTFTLGVSLVRRLPLFASRAEGRSDEEVAAQIERYRAERGPFVNTAGSLISPPNDLQRFLQFHADSRVTAMAFDEDKHLCHRKQTDDSDQKINAII